MKLMVSSLALLSALSLSGMKPELPVPALDLSKAISGESKRDSLRSPRSIERLKLEKRNPSIGADYELEKRKKAAKEKPGTPEAISPRSPSPYPDSKSTRGAKSSSLSPRIKVQS